MSALLNELRGEGFKVVHSQTDDENADLLVIAVT
jgi:hypothetical protein